MTDERYIKYIDPHQPGSTLLFNLAGINNLPKPVSGTVKLKIYDAAGKSSGEQIFPVKLPSYLRTDIPVAFTLRIKAGGYLLVAEFTPENGTSVISRRFLKVGETSTYFYYQMKYP